jgi:hypothetical protein
MFLAGRAMLSHPQHEDVPPQRRNTRPEDIHPRVSEY